MKSEKQTLNWDIENEYYEKGYRNICGTDEVGRGPLFGPVVAAACVLPHGFIIPGLNDSKKLSEKKREEIYQIIVENALAYAIETVSAAEIDQINILAASQLAMRNAVKSIMDNYLTPSIVFVDGNIARDFPCETLTLVKGDSRSPNIAAASILAKVTRDRICYEYDEIYPKYGLAKHKGYPTKEHMDAVREHGPSPLHRLTFLKFLDK